LNQLIARIIPILGYLRTLHNFTIESQVQFHARLAFTPHQLEEMYAVSREDLSVFVNSAEWTLCSFVLSFLVQILKRLSASSSSNDPVLHFVLFVPSLQRRPLRILARDSECLFLPSRISLRTVVC
jgi:phosphatidylinositol glycan class S